MEAATTTSAVQAADWKVKTEKAIPAPVEKEATKPPVALEATRVVVATALLATREARSRVEIAHKRAPITRGEEAVDILAEVPAAAIAAVTTEVALTSAPLRASRMSLSVLLVEDVDDALVSVVDAIGIARVCVKPLGGGMTSAAVISPVSLFAVLADDSAA